MAGNAVTAGNRQEMPKLFHFSLDPFSRRLRLALAEYGLPFELIEQRPWEPDAALYRFNAAGVVPVYITEGDEPLSGIEAITEYLEETRGERPSLIPGT